MSETLTLPSNILDCHKLIATLSADVENLSVKLKMYAEKLKLAIDSIYGQSSEQSRYIEDDIKKKIESMDKQKGLIQLELFSDVLADIQKYQDEAAAIVENAAKRKC